MAACRSLFATLTRGSGMLHRAFQTYGHYKGPLDKVRKGVLISMAGPLLLLQPAFTRSRAITDVPAVNHQSSVQSLMHPFVHAFSHSTIQSCETLLPVLQGLICLSGKCSTLCSGYKGRQISRTCSILYVHAAYLHTHTAYLFCKPLQLTFRCQATMASCSKLHLRAFGDA